MRTFRTIGFAFLALIAAGILLGGTRSHRGTDVAELVTTALEDARTNEVSARGAPQQAVVNGWVARDLLTIQSLQLRESLDEQRRTNALLLIGLAGLGLHLLTRQSVEDEEKAIEAEVEDALAVQNADTDREGGASDTVTPSP